MSKNRVQRNGEVPRIAIVGLGFSGTVTAIRLMQFATGPLTLKVFEGNSSQAHGGFVYGSEGLLKDHFLNIHAGRISLYRERPDDFLKWAAEDADRDGKPGRTNEDWTYWRNLLKVQESELHEWEGRLKFSEFSAVPRRLYAEYLRDRFEDSVALTKGVVDCTVVSSNVDSVQPREHDADIWFRDPITNQSTVETYDVVVMCTGHGPPVIPDPLRDVSSHPNFFSHPYLHRFGSVMAGDKFQGENLLVIGSGLTGFDAAVTAAANGFKGKLIFLSRHGLKHQSYPPDHSHTILPSIYGRFFAGVVDSQRMRTAIEEAVEQAREDFAQYFLDESEGVLPERVFKAIEPQVAEFVHNAPEEEVQRFLSSYQSWLTTNRTSVVPEVAQLVDTLDIQSVRGEIVGSEGDEAGLSIHYVPTNERGEQIENEEVAMVSASLVVSCVGFSSDYTRATGTWGQLLAKGHVVPHPKTRLGIAVGNNGKIVSSHGTSFNSLYAVGPMREGDEIERRGRLGAFTFSIGTTRNQALMCALSVLKQVEDKDYQHLNEPSRVRCKRGLHEFLQNNQVARQEFHRLVARTSDVQFLPPSAGRDEAISQIISSTHELSVGHRCPGIPKRIFSYFCWQAVRLRAGKMVTEIRRLSDRQTSVKSYRPGSTALCHAEKKDCKDHLKLMMNQIHAQSFSLSVYFPAQQRLYPFIDHLRLNRFTPTTYGRNNAGILLKGYVESLPPGGLFPSGEVMPYDVNGRVVGILIPNYNSTPDIKQHFKRSPRLYPNVLVALVTSGDEVVGAVYFEAPLSRRFSDADMEQVLANLGSIPRQLRKVRSSWTPRADLDRQNMVLDFEKAKLDWRSCDGSNSSLKEADLDESCFSGAVLNGSDFRSSNLSYCECTYARVLGARFGSARMEGIDFRGANIGYSDFANANLQDSRFEGALIEYCDLSDSLICDATLSGVRLSKSNLDQSDLSRTQMIRMEIKDCSWQNVILDDVLTDRSTFEQLPSDLQEAYIKKVHFVD